MLSDCRAGNPRLVQRCPGALTPPSSSNAGTDIYQIVLGEISSLSAGPTASALKDRAPLGARRVGWLAGRIIFASGILPLTEMTVGQPVKPAFSTDVRLWFNLSHSGDDIALRISDEGDVGCDIEVLHPRASWRSLAENLFSAQEQGEIAAEAPGQQLAAFWRIWTLNESIIKQRGASAWQMARIDSTAPTTLSVSTLQAGGRYADTVYIDGCRGSNTGGAETSLWSRWRPVITSFPKPGVFDLTRGWVFKKRSRFALIRDEASTGIFRLMPGAWRRVLWSLDASQPTFAR